MGRTPCCDKANVKKGQWTPEEDWKLKEYMEKNGTEGNWTTLPQKAARNGTRLNILRHELTTMIFVSIQNSRTDNDIKNYWNTKLKKKFLLEMVPSMRQKNHPEAITYSLHHNSSVESPYSASTALQTQDGYVGVGPTHNNQINDSRLIIFGSGEASCSSSDGSCTTNHIISHGQEVVEYDHGFSSHFSSGIDENTKLKLTKNGDSVNGYVCENPTNICFYEDSLDYSIEVMKQLDYTNNFSNNWI